MQPYLKTVAKIFIFRDSPASMPYSVAGLLLSILVTIGIQVVQVPSMHFKVFILLAAGFLLMAGFYALILSRRGFSERFVQTFTAAVGCQLIESVLLLAASFVPSVFHYFSILMVFWGFAITSYLIKNAAEIKVEWAILLTIAYEFVLMSLLFYLSVWLGLLKL